MIQRRSIGIAMTGAILGAFVVMCFCWAIKSYRLTHFWRWMYFPANGPMLQGACAEREESWRPFVKDGLFILLLRPDGEIRYTFAGGVRNGESCLFAAGRLLSRSNYTNDLQSGLDEHWYVNGQKESESYYEEGQKEGPYVGYYPRGTLHFKGAYRGDKMEGKWEEWYDTGHKCCDKWYSQGQCVKEDWGNPGNLSDGERQSLVRRWRTTSPTYGERERERVRLLVRKGMPASEVLRLLGMPRARLYSRDWDYVTWSDHDSEGFTIHFDESNAVDEVSSYKLMH